VPRSIRAQTLPRSSPRNPRLPVRRSLSKRQGSPKGRPNEATA
jgi:hypothetical protein